MNLVHATMTEADIELFLGPIDPNDPRDKIVRFETTDMGSLLAQAGAFPSAKQARKNGWADKTVPQGFSEVKVGKRRFWVLAPFG